MDLNMKKLNENIQWKGEKGKSFEDLVKVILQQMFPSISFIQTNYVCDGGKDFYSVGNSYDETIWVEAKNYNNHLELSKFSNTFIMADISEINRIILFSMSELTTGAKINVARYAAYHKKTVSVYAGNDILILLNKYRNVITISDYIIDINNTLQTVLSSDIGEPDCSVSVNCEYYYAKQFNLAYRRDKDNHITPNSVQYLALHSLIAQEIHITNHDLFHSKTVKLDCSEYEENYVESYFYGAQPDRILICPASTSIIVVFFKITNACDKIKLPTIKFETDIDFEDSVCQNIVECCWLGEIPYMGEGWNKLQDAVRTLESDPAKRFIVLKGKSGVGKTRFLKEISGYYFQRGYRIISLDYQSMTDLSLKNVLQSILFNVYNLDSSTHEDVAYIDQFGEQYKDFYDVLFNDNYNYAEHMDKLCVLLLSLLVRKKMLLLIDNVQDINSEAATFFERLLFDINNSNALESLLILCFNQDFLFQGKASTKLLAYLEQLNGSLQVTLENFSKPDAKIYLRECFDPRELRSDMDTYYDEIIKRFGTNPFVLKQLMLYLKQRNIFTFVDAMVCISDFEAMIHVLNELPEGINNILQYRYAHLLRNISPNNNLDRIIWSVLFLGSVQSDFALKLNLEKKGIQFLLDYGFLEYNEKSEIVFCHQLIEKSFCIYFMNHQYIENPSLSFIDDDAFLRHFFNVINRIGRTNLCVENMVLRTRLDLMESESLNCALKRLTLESPRTIMLLLVINSINECLNAGVTADPHLEFQALYYLSLACQDRLNVRLAGVYMKNSVIFEQATYKKKLIAKEEMIQFFKHHVFQLPYTEKLNFLDWLLKEVDKFCLAKNDYEDFLGWIHNRYSKDLCELHCFDDALDHVKDALELALNRDDFCSAAEAEIEYGNIYAYSNAKEAIRHWEKSVYYISICNNDSYYFQVYRHGYYVLSQLFAGEISDELASEIEKLQNLRGKTFLYQQLFIDDICADYYIIQYMNGKCGAQSLKDMIPQLSRMKADSYNYTPEIAVLATYKLFTVYRLLCEVELTDVNKDMGKMLAYELIKNNIFAEGRLDYSEMILNDIFRFCRGKSDLEDEILHELPENAQKKFLQFKETDAINGKSHAVTLLSDKKRQVNLLHFNYIF